MASACGDDKKGSLEPMIPEPKIPALPTGSLPGFNPPQFPSIPVGVVPPQIWSIGDPVFPGQLVDDLHVFEDSNNAAVDLAKCKKTTNVCAAYFVFPRELKIEENPETKARRLSHAIYNPSNYRAPQFSMEVRYNITFDFSTLEDRQEKLRTVLAAKLGLSADQVKVSVLPAHSVHAFVVPLSKDNPLAHQPGDEIPVSARNVYSTVMVKFDASRASRIISFGATTWDLEPEFSRALLSKDAAAGTKVQLGFQAKGKFRSPESSIACDLDALNRWKVAAAAAMRRIRFNDFNSKDGTGMGWSALSSLKAAGAIPDAVCEPFKTYVSPATREALLDAALQLVDLGDQGAAKFVSGKDYAGTFSLYVDVNGEGLDVEGNFSPQLKLQCGRSEKLVPNKDSVGRYECEKACDERKEVYSPKSRQADARGCVAVDQFDLKEFIVR